MKNELGCIIMIFGGLVIIVSMMFYLIESINQDIIFAFITSGFFLTALGGFIMFINLQFANQEKAE